MRGEEREREKKKSGKRETTRDSQSDSARVSGVRGTFKTASRLNEREREREREREGGRGESKRDDRWAHRVPIIARGSLCFDVFP